MPQKTMKMKMISVIYKTFSTHKDAALPLLHWWRGLEVLNGNKNIANTKATHTSQQRLASVCVWISVIISASFANDSKSKNVVLYALESKLNKTESSLYIIHTYIMYLLVFFPRKQW